MDESHTPHETPLVSVVIPTYNRAAFVAETIRSVLAQRYANIEIIVVDDGSTDQTRDVVEQFASKVRYVWQENAERGASRNHGLRLANGKYVAFLDSDDAWLPATAEQCVEVLEADPAIGLVYGDAVQIDEHGKEVRDLRARGPSGDVTDYLLQRNFVIMPAHLARTAAVKEIGGFREQRELSGSEDWEMWVRFSLRTRFAYLPTVLARYRVHAENTISNPAMMRRSMASAVGALRSSGLLSPHHLKKLTRIEAEMALVNAINYCSQGDLRQSAKFLKEAAARDPRVLPDPRFAYTILRLLRYGYAGLRGSVRPSHR